jgi:hypothetical protein
MMTPILAVAVAAIIFIYYKHTDFYKKRLLPNLSWTCALALSTTKAWELAIQILMNGVTDPALIAKSETLLIHVDTIITGSITIAVALTVMMFVPKEFFSKK